MLKRMCCFLIKFQISSYFSSFSRSFRWKTFFHQKTKNNYDGIWWKILFHSMNSVKVFHHKHEMRNFYRRCLVIFRIELCVYLSTYFRGKFIYLGGPEPHSFPPEIFSASEFFRVLIKFYRSTEKWYKNVTERT